MYSSRPSSPRRRGRAGPQTAPRCPRRSGVLGPRSSRTTCRAPGSRRPSTRCRRTPPRPARRDAAAQRGQELRPGHLPGNGRRPIIDDQRLPGGGLVVGGTARRHSTTQLASSSASAPGFPRAVVAGPATAARPLDGERGNGALHGLVAGVVLEGEQSLRRGAATVHGCGASTCPTVAAGGCPSATMTPHVDHGNDHPVHERADLAAERAVLDPHRDGRRDDRDVLDEEVLPRTRWLLPTMRVGRRERSVWQVCALGGYALGSAGSVTVAAASGDPTARRGPPRRRRRRCLPAGHGDHDRRRR